MEYVAVVSDVLLQLKWILLDVDLGVVMTIV